MLYIFLCRNCAETIRLNLPMNAAKPTVCRCGGDLQRVWKASLPNVVYRGSGFYTTDKHLTPVDLLDYDPEVH